jgi:DNA primase
MFAGFQKVFIFGDGDKAGTDFSKTVNDSLTNGQRILLPTGLDVNDVYLQGGQEKVLALMQEN